jgi:uncharacterized membrane protein
LQSFAEFFPPDAQRLPSSIINMTRFLIPAGAVVGLLMAAVPLGVAYLSAPGLPGPFELGVQAAFAVVSTALGAGAGGVVKWLLSFSGAKR